MTNIFTHIDKCLLKWIWLNNTKRRYKWHCCLLLFLAWLITESVYNDEIPYIYLFNAAVYRWKHDNKIRIFLINFRFQIGNDRQSKRLLANLGRIFFFIFFWIKTGIRDFLLDIYFAYKSFVWTAALGLEFSGSNDVVLI
jgi:hypothetical protein